MKFNIGDATYWYEIHGIGEPVVFLHGFTGSSQTWSPLVHNLKSKFQIVTIDLPGHGKTKINSPRTMEACCHDLNQLFQHLSLESVHLVGYSMGGRTALSFAMLYPGLIKSLILESASPGLALQQERHNRRANDEKLAERIEKEGLESFVDFWENIPLFNTQKQLPSNKQKIIRDERMSHTEKGLACSLRHMGTGSQPSWWNELSNFHKPVLLMAGEYDHKFVKINERMKESLSNSDLRIIKNAGHAIHVEQAEIFGKIVTEFILQNSL
ncbi:2-succinyl-6-hydroxy-2,4-cyclohexadiene-1-carboxylate synthase [Ornithinibacillus sp. L9]|uniref:Putative 2-succinyl-6-hydroxy-2,4-cyclohexadiene-1-carboxylate synthase n=1 Tax=Ornithinibacillus caprae TaxID=2678566 RepID=A0A6N8FNJ6_9BACI|nr:2-succinyl-6-hydroxy-2,4-cyclohexadiene-1-carboxylate synthase [Ornithinibacillus caprae]MUK90044.1 2-succinyl-6-hydroxy-2,4-cyclohexadiene-1-carboxylate synthase [Ornithinibacillus caprae]